MVSPNELEAFRTMNRKLISLIATLAIGIPSYGHAQGGPPASELAVGMRQVEEGDLDAAVITLDTVIQRLATVKGTEKDRATAHLYLSMAHLGLSQWERARAEMREAWRNNKELRLDPLKFPPRVLQTFEEAKQDAKGTDASQPLSKDQPSPPPGPTPQVVSADKKGGSKGLLVIGGLALAGGGVAAAGGGSNPPSPTPLPASTPVISTPPQEADLSGAVVSCNGSQNPIPISTATRGDIGAPPVINVRVSSRVAISSGRVQLDLIFNSARCLRGQSGAAPIAAGSFNDFPVSQWRVVANCALPFTVNSTDLIFFANDTPFSLGGNSGSFTKPGCFFYTFTP
jgi:hypothetical protein